MKNIALARQFLQGTQLADGSWPYQSQTAQGYPEPTVYGLLASQVLGASSQMSSSALDWLAARVQADGSLSLEGDNEPNWGSSLLIIALTHLNTQSNLRERAIDWLLQWRSKQAEYTSWIPLDGDLIGWGWISGTLGWVEPTGYATLALKMNGVAEHERVIMAEKLLADRACADGGWNVGNPVVLGRDLEGFLPPTAVALLALQDKPLETPSVHNGLAFLQDQPLTIHSTMSLALSILCLHAYNLPFDSYIAPLQNRQQADGSWRQNVQLTGLAVLALHAAAGGPNVFKL